MFLELIVLSAAHCFKAEQIKGVSDIVKSKYKVIAGKYFRDYDAKEDLPTQTLKVTDITIPERYTGMKGYYYGDIAVLTLDKIIIYQNHISPVCLNFSAKDNNKSLPAEDTNGFVAGFGVTEEGVSSATLKILSLPYIPYTKCIAFVPDEYTSYIQSDKFCAGSNNTGGVCKGDSGGGISFKHNDTYFIYGILSNALFFNETSCNLHMYSLFTKVMDHIGMIYDKYLNSTKILRNLLENPKNTETEYI